MRVISYYSDTVCDFIWTCPFHFVLLYCVMYCCVVLYFVLFHSVSFSCILSTLPINKHAMFSFLTTQWRQQSLSEDKFQPRSFFQVLKRCVTNYYNCWGSCQSLIETFVIRRAAWPRPLPCAGDARRDTVQLSWVVWQSGIESWLPCRSRRVYTSSDAVSSSCWSTRMLRCCLKNTQPTVNVLLYSRIEDKAQ